MSKVTWLESEYQDPNIGLFDFGTHEAKIKNMHAHTLILIKMILLRAIREVLVKVCGALKDRISSCLREERGNVHLGYLSLALKDGEK